jgi:hypothetical protein
MTNRILLIVMLTACTAAAQTPQPPQQVERKNFLSCPVVQDTKTVPCWVAEYRGELYYLGIQSDISADFHPPYLGHKVLVEGVVSDEPRICGGVVLKPVVVSPILEPDANCNTILPAVDKYTVPFAPRPPGPSGGSLAFATPPAAPPSVQPPFVPREFSIYYDFDMTVMGRHAGLLSQIVDYAEKTEAKRLIVSSYRGSTLLSDGSLLSEKQGIAQARAAELADLLKRAGVTKPVVQIKPSEELEPAHGVEDWKSRRSTIRIEP